MAEELERTLEPMEGTRAWYNAIASIYDVLASSGEKKAIETGLAILDLKEGERVLEIGYGTGHALRSLARSAGPSGRVYGVDISDAMYRIVKAAVERNGLEDRVVLLREDARHLPFQEGFFDAVFMSFTLELFSDADIPALLEECNRVLRNGGRLCIVSLGKREPPNIAEQVYEGFHRIFPRFLDCRPIFLSDRMVNAGFTILEKREMSLWGLPVDIVLGVR